MGEFNSDNPYFYYYGQKSLRRNVVALIVNKRVLNAATWAQSQKQQDYLVHFQGKPFNITVIQVYAPTTKAEVKWFYEDLEDLLDLTPKKRCPFHHRGLGCESRKSRDTWSNRQIWPWSTKRSRAKGNRVFPREHTGYSKHPLQSNTRDNSTHGHHQMVNTEIRLIIFFSAKDETLYTVSKNKTGS